MLSLAIFVMVRKVEERANVSLCIKLGKSATGALSMFQQAYSNEAVGHMLQKEKKAPGRPAMSNMETIHQFVLEDHQKAMNDIAEGTVEAISMSMKTWILYPVTELSSLASYSMVLLPHLPSHPI